MNKKLTKTLVDSLAPQNSDYLVNDTELKGFQCKVTLKGKRSFAYYYRFRGKQRRPKIGDFGAITVDQARAIAKDWAGKVASGIDPHEEKAKARAEITIKQLHEEYNLKYGPKLKQKTLKENNYLWKNHVIPKLGNLKVNSINTSDIAKFHSELSAKKRTANRALEVLSKALSLAEDWKYRDEGFNPCSKIKKYPENKKERYLSNTELKTLFEVLDDLELKRGVYQPVIDALRLLIHTGCRKSEILELKWSYIDFEKKRIDFPDSKTGKKSTPLSNFAIALLKNIKREKSNPYVIPSKIKKGEHIINIQKSWDTIRKKAGINDVRVHDLRHSFASIGINQGLSLSEIGRILGHNNIRTTQRYAHLAEDKINKSANIIGDAINNSGKNKD